MIIKSKEAVGFLRTFFIDIIYTYPYKKDYTLRKNASRKTKEKIKRDYVKFINDFVTAYVRPKKEGERIDVCGIIIPKIEEKILYYILKDIDDETYAFYGLEAHKDDCDEVWFDTDKLFTTERS